MFLYPVLTILTFPTAFTERIIPPPVTESFCTVELQVEGLVLERQNNSDPSCIQLLCTLEGLDPLEVNFTWSRQGQGSQETLSANHRSKLNSSLTLCQSEWTECDTITCEVSHSANHSSFSESIKLPCNVESCAWEHHHLVIRVAYLCSFAGTVAIVWIILRVRMVRKALQTEKGTSVVTTEMFQTVSPTNVNI